MKLSITVYKGTGKYYTGHEVEVPDMEMFKEGYLDLIRSNMPGCYHDGYVVVTDAADNQGFHNALYTWSYLFPEEYCGRVYQDMWDKRVRGEISEKEFKQWFDAYCEHCHYMYEVCMHGEEN